jgi:predicted nuclease of predicted toxin-antitoxin system
MVRFLANENISPLTVSFIKDLGYDIKSVKETGLKGASDSQVVQFALQEKRWIITLDLDYAEIYYYSPVLDLGIIVLRLKSQWYKHINTELGKLIKSGKLETEEYKNSLIIINEGRYRIHKKR